MEIGIEGVSRKVKAGYVGVNGVARKFAGDSLEKITVHVKADGDGITAYTPNSGPVSVPSGTTASFEVYMGQYFAVYDAADGAGTYDATGCTVVAKGGEDGTWGHCLFLILPTQDGATFTAK